MADRIVSAELATSMTIAPYGRLLRGPQESEIEIPYYRGRVVEGGDIGMQYRGGCCFRLATIRSGLDPVTWLERHQHLTQLFIGLGDAPMVMVLAEPGALPEGGVDGVRAFWFPPGSALMLHPGTWHDFPLAPAGDLTVLTVSSVEVIEALTTTRKAVEIDCGDVEKIDVQARFGTRAIVDVAAVADVGPVVGAR